MQSLFLPQLKSYHLNKPKNAVNLAKSFIPLPAMKTAEGWGVVEVKLPLPLPPLQNRGFGLYFLQGGIDMGRGNYPRNALEIEIEILLRCKEEPKDQNSIKNGVRLNSKALFRHLHHLTDCGCLTEGKKGVYHITPKGADALVAGRNLIMAFNIV